MLTNAPIAAMLPVVNLDRAREFYEDKLGLSLYEDMSSADTVMYQCGQGTMLGVYQRATPTTADHTAASWLVDDLEGTIKTLSAKGVRFEHYDMPGLKTNEMGIAELGRERGAWFKDPEGNILAVVQMI
ncbi:VOC family protein [Aggregatilinea lenta]|uniref:VOC family protein n=1 Tax=Aggregatilinea lenta TaxID=913108 RepID=UPI000E5B5DBB|nr:VOC family protein [Aggregatilinea lenta]